MSFKNLEEKLDDANRAYRIGQPIMSDEEYERHLADLTNDNPESTLLNTIGTSVSDESRKVRLPMTMASMNKVKSYDELVRWMKLKNISADTLLVITPKYDGISLCVNETTGEAFTRGDGEYGQRSDEHFKLLQNKMPESNSKRDFFTCGEVLLPRSVFAEKYAAEYANGRNLIAGKFNDKKAQDILKDAVYIRYGIKDADGEKLLELEYLNAFQKVAVPYIWTTIDKLSDEELANIFKKFSGEFELDGLIIEVNDKSLREQLGRETSTGNPCYARAFKGAFEEVKESVVTSINWSVSKQGLVKPVIQIEPVSLDGATVTNITGNNAKYIKTMGIGKGAIVRVKRSGMVIPLITEVVKTVEFEMPQIDGAEIEWSASGIELITIEETDAQRFKQLVSFFEILGIENVSEGIFSQLWEKGCKTVKQVLAITVSDLARLDNFRDRKAQNVYDAIQNSVKGVKLCKAQHASGFFKTLGSRKLALLAHFEEIPTLEKIVKIDGFAETSAQEYLNGIVKFNEFIKDLPIEIERAEQSEPTGGEFSEKTFVFTGVRRADLESIIVAKGGRIGSGVSKNTDFLVMKEVGSGSSKEQKALELGVKVITVGELEKLLG